MNGIQLQLDELNKEIQRMVIEVKQPIDTESVPPVNVDVYEKMSHKELKDFCNLNNIRGISKKNKQQLVEKIRVNQFM